MAKGAFARLKADERPPAPSQPVPAAEMRTGRQPSRIGKKTVIFYDDPAVVRALKHLATDEDTTMQALMQEAVDLLLVSKGKHAFGNPGKR